MNCKEIREKVYKLTEEEAEKILEKCFFPPPPVYAGKWSIRDFLFFAMIKNEVNRKYL